MPKIVIKISRKKAYKGNAKEIKINNETGDVLILIFNVSSYNKFKINDKQMWNKNCKQD